MTDVVCYYRDPVKAPLLREAVLPALTATGHVERHWLHGPHLRIRVDDPEPFADALRAWLAVAPSAVDVTDAELLARSRVSGVAELVAPPYEPIHPDNTVRVEPTDTSRVRALLGSDVLVDLRTRCLRLGVPALRDAVAEDRTGGERVRLALTAMAAHATRFPAGLHNGYHSFLSHVEDFLLHHDPDGVVRARFERTWERNADQVTEVVRQVGDGPWTAWTESTRVLIEEVFDRGELPTGPDRRYGERAAEVGDEGAVRRWHPDHRDYYSEYHRRLRAVDLEHPRYRRPVAVYRFGTNMLYQLLAVCDVTPVERYLAASLLARAAQRISGVTWSEHITHLAETTR